MKNFLLVSVLVLLLFGCSGGGGGDSSASSTPQGSSDDNKSISSNPQESGESDGLTPPIVTPSVTISGFVYLRDASTSYDLNLTTATTKLNCDSISLKDANGTCSDAGTYNLTLTTPNYDPIVVTKTAYIPMEYTVWGEANQTVPIGLYTAPTVGSKPTFMKGMVFLDLGNTYPFSYWEQVIDEPKSRLNADLVSYVYNSFNNGCSTTNHTVSISSAHPLYPDWRMPTESELAPLVAKVHAAGMQFNLWLDLVNVDTCNGTIDSWDANDTAFWDTWFSEYDTLLKQRAQVAKNLGIEWLTLGHNFAYASEKNATRWATIINDIKAVYPAVKVSYFGGTDFSGASPYFESDNYNRGANQAAFANLFDAIGYMVNTVSKTQNPSQNAIKTSFEAIESKASSFSVPVWVSPATPSTTKGASDPTFMEPELNSNDIALSYTTDFYQQADVYEALFEVINASSGGNGHIMGVLPWGYHLKNNYRDSGTESNSNPNTGNLILDRTANIRGKPAESLVKWWYSQL